MEATEILIESIGWIGSVLIVTAYLLNVRRKLSSKAPSFLLMNFLGALCFIVHTYVHRAVPSMVVNFIWAIVALSALIKKSSKRKSASKN